MGVKSLSCVLPTCKSNFVPNISKLLPLDRGQVTVKLTVGLVTGSLGEGYVNPGSAYETSPQK